jgi:hypothetical protein
MGWEAERSVLQRGIRAIRIAAGASLGGCGLQTWLGVARRRVKSTSFDWENTLDLFLTQLKLRELLGRTAPFHRVGGLRLVSLCFRIGRLKTVQHFVGRVLQP